MGVCYDGEASFSVEQSQKDSLGPVNEDPGISLCIKSIITGFCIIVYRFRFQKYLCGRVCCGWVWLCHLRFSEHEQRRLSTSHFVRWKCCCWFHLVSLCYYFINLNHRSFSNEPAIPKQAFTGDKPYRCLLASHMTLKVTVSVDLADPRVRALNCISCSLTFVRSFQPRGWGSSNLAGIFDFVLESLPPGINLIIFFK